MQFFKDTTLCTRFSWLKMCIKLAIYIKDIKMTEGLYCHLLRAENLEFYSFIDCSYSFNDSFWRLVLTSD